MNNTVEVLAFKVSTIDQINSLAAKIDPRLYLFADYEPKVISSNDSSRLQFLMNVINVYALMFDCGKILQMHVLSIWNDRCRPAVMGQLAQKYLSSYSNLLELVMSIRNPSCHNMSKKYYNNNSYWICYREYLIAASGEERDFHEYSERDWARVNLKFNQCCKDAEADLAIYLQALVDITQPDEKEKIVNYWIDSIIKWYVKDNNHMVDHILCSYYAPKAYPRRADPYSARMWLGTSWKAFKNLQGISAKNAADDYLLECEHRISILLKDPKYCPTPALPMDIYKALTNDVHLFT